MRRFNLALLILLLLVGMPYYWLFLDNSAPRASPQPVTMAQLRALAGPDARTGPNRIRFEEVGATELMGNRLAVGSGLRPVRLHWLAFQLEYADGAPVLIGSGLARAQEMRSEPGKFMPRAQARVDAALASAASLVHLTIADSQLGGLHTIAGTARGKALASQLAEQQRADLKGSPYALAPGVVIIPMPQLRASARLVYVRTSAGREYLFAGNLAPIRQSWESARLPARFVTDFGRREDRAAIRSWLLTLRNLKREAPELVVVPGYAIPRRSGLERFFGDYKPAL